VEFEALLGAMGFAVLGYFDQHWKNGLPDKGGSNQALVDSDSTGMVARG